jgi:Rap1a immunity proteins
MDNNSGFTAVLNPTRDKILTTLYRGKSMKKLSFTLAAVSTMFAALVTFNANADQKIPVLSAQELVNHCKFPASPESRSYCIGYTTAIYDTYLATRHPQRAKNTICVKQPAPKRDEVIADYVQFISQTAPMLANDPAAGTFLSFLTMRFPCAKK